MVRSSEPLLLHAMLALRLLLLCLHPHTAALWAMRYHIDKAEADPFVRIKSILEVIAYLSPRAAAKFLLCGMHKPWTSTTVFQPPPPLSSCRQCTHTAVRGAGGAEQQRKCS